MLYTHTHRYTNRWMDSYSVLIVSVYLIFSVTQLNLYSELQSLSGIYKPICRHAPDFTVADGLISYGFFGQFCGHFPFLSYLFVVFSLSVTLLVEEGRLLRGLLSMLCTTWQMSVNSLCTTSQVVLTIEFFLLLLPFVSNYLQLLPNFPYN